MNRMAAWRSMAVAVCGVVLLAACAQSSDGTESGGEERAVAASAPAAPEMTVAQARDYFLMVVCPVTTSLKIVDNISVEAGGWPKVVPARARQYTTAAAEAARRAAKQLKAPDRVWSAALQPSIDRMSENFLGMIVPLEEMSKAATGAAMAAPWQKVALDPRIPEQQARLDLGLPAANAAKDGCPPVPRATPKVTPTATASPSPAAGQSGSSSPNSWQSPSGNLRCAYFREGSQGPSVACLDADTNQLVILNQGYTRASSASASQRAQLPGGSVMNMGESRTVGGMFTCGLTDNGMTCVSHSSRVYFEIRRGYLYRSDMPWSD